MKLNFIPDQDINLEKNDLLGTKPYVNTLLEIIKQTDAQFTVGLFGSWGSGKSSIIKTIKEKYNNDKFSKTKVFVYDAWKYSKDSFRRTFILKLKEEFNLEEGENYQNFYNDSHEDVAHKSKIDKKKTFFGLLYLLPLLLLFSWFITNINIGLKITLSIISTISTIIFYFLKDIYVQYKISITRPKTFAPEQFENAFTDAVQTITKKESFLGWFKFWDKTIYTEKLVIVIDNIDRCHKELAFELLLTVKTFLEQKNKEIIFILPIDENEIKKHIKTSGHDGNEFLRKLFNTTLTIKKFSEDDLFKFTQQIKNKHDLDLTDDVLSLISQEFSRSPRKIIQFLNVLQTEIKLAEEQETKGVGNFKKGYITENIEFLVKVLLIREEWTNLYEKIKKNPFLLDDINEQIDNGKEKVVYDKDSEEKDIFLTSEQKRFFESTRYISATNVEAFFSNKDAFPDFPDDLPKLVLAQDWETIKTKYLEKNVFEFNKFLFFIDTLFKREVLKRKLKRSSFNIFSLLFKIAKNEKYKAELLRCFYSSGKPLLDIKSKLNGNDINNIILNFNPKLLLNFVKTDLTKNSRLLQKIINVINNKENNGSDHYDLLTEFINEFQDNETHAKAIGERFSDILKEFPTVFDNFKEILANAVAAEALIKPNLLEEFIQGLKQNPDTENIKEKIEIINQYDSSKGLSDKLLAQYIKRIVDFLGNNNLTSDIFWIKQLLPLIKKMKDDSIKESVFAMLTQKNNFLWQQYNYEWSQEEYQECLYNFLDIANEYYILSKASKSDITSWFTNFFMRNESSKLRIKINKLYKKIINHFLVFDWSFSDQLINKFNQFSEWEDKKEIAGTLNLMLSKTTDEKGLNESQIQTILNNYINNINTDEESIQLWLSSAIKNTVVKPQLSKVISELNITDKLNILKIIKELDKDLLEESVKEIISETSIDDLEKNFEKLDNSEVFRTLINKGILQAVKNLQQEDDKEYFKEFLSFISERNKLPENIRVVIVNKISSFLHDEKTKEEKLFALQILDKITIPKEKKTLIKELLKDLNIDNYNDEEKALFEKIKSSKH